MSYTTDARIITRPRKSYRCYWCSELIDGEHMAWSTFDGGRAHTTRVHVECCQAWDKGLSGDDADYFREDVMYGSHCRGCLCERGRCECTKGGAA